jgi:hypothetical protein
MGVMRRTVAERMVLSARTSPPVRPTFEHLDEAWL